jgi:hypothetical protein
MNCYEYSDFKLRILLAFDLHQLKAPGAMDHLSIEEFFEFLGLNQVSNVGEVSVSILIKVHPCGKQVLGELSGILLLACLIISLDLLRYHFSLRLHLLVVF